MANELILVVEDDLQLRQVVCEYLRNESYTTLEAGDGVQALRLWEQNRPDLIVLDWMLPARSGLDVAREVRSKASTPIIMLTARNEEPDVIVGLEVGADDYLVKPVSMRQLVARIRAVLRRTRPEPAARDLITLGDVRIDLTGHTVERAGEPVALTATQFKLLAVLARNPNRVFTRLQLLEAAVGYAYEGYERTIDSHISRIRTKLAVDDLIETVHGIGYKLVLPGRRPE
jgi:two-component system OmpR family response regulator